MARYQRSKKMSDGRRRSQYAARRAKWTAGIVLALVGVVIVDRLGLLGSRPPGDLARYSGESFLVVRVIDGDTLDVDVLDSDGEPTRIRLWGVDTPETVKPDTPPQHFGSEASKFTRQAVGDKMVRIELVGQRTRGQHGRLLAYVYLPDGEMLNRLLVAEGYGYADPRFDHPHKREFSRLQGQAKAAGLGLWRDVTRADLPYYYQDMRLPSRDETTGTDETDKRPATDI